MTSGRHISLGMIDEELGELGDGASGMRATVNGEMIEESNDFLIHENIGALVALLCFEKRKRRIKRCSGRLTGCHVES
jgi:hypothetical protein